MTSSKIRDSAVPSSKVKDGSLLATDFKPGQLVAGAPGATGAAGAPGPTGATGPAGPQGPAGAPATTRTSIVNWQSNSMANASSGVAFVARTDDRPTHSQVTSWDVPQKTSDCAVLASPSGSNGFYAFYTGTPSIQTARVAGAPNRVVVETQWLGGTGTDFSLLVTCP